MMYTFIVLVRMCTKLDIFGKIIIYQMNNNEKIKYFQTRNIFLNAVIMQKKKKKRISSPEKYFPFIAFFKISRLLYILV